jgi:phage host-nuclease inhibitor protein Gam
MSSFQNSYYDPTAVDQSKKMPNTQEITNQFQQMFLMQQPHRLNEHDNNNTGESIGGNKRKKTKKKRGRDDNITPITIGQQPQQFFGVEQQPQHQDAFDAESTNDSNVSLDLDKDEFENMAEELSQIELMTPTLQQQQQQQQEPRLFPYGYTMQHPISDNRRSSGNQSGLSAHVYYNEQQEQEKRKEWEALRQLDSKPKPQLHINARKTNFGRFEANAITTASTDSPSTQIATPTSPSRVPFQSISTVSTLTQSLEEAAMSSQPNTRSLLWKEWALLIRESEADNPPAQTYMDDNYQLMTFKEAFLKSQALELVAESVINDPDVKDDSLWDLFSQCLIGDDNDHYQLIACLKQIGEQLRAYRDLIAKIQQEKPGEPVPTRDLSELVTDISIKIISRFKIKPEQQRLLATKLTNIDEQILEKERLLASKNKAKNSTKNLNYKAAVSGELVFLCNQKRNFLTSVSQNLETVQQADNIFNACIRHVERAIRGRWDEEDDELESEEYPHSNSDTGGNSVSFSHLGDVQTQMKQLEEERASVQEKYATKLKAVDENLVQLSTSANALLERKRKLEEELKSVNLQLTKVKEDQDLLQKDKELQQAQYSHILQIFDQRMLELREMSQYQNAEPVLSALHDFIDKTRVILVENLKKRNDDLEQVIHQSTQRYIEQVASYLEQQNQRMLEILKNKILFLCEKLNSLRKRYQELLSSNKDREAHEKLKKIKFYYHKYVTSEKIAKDILLDAENINQLIHNLPFAANYATYIHQIDNQLTVLSDSENLMLKCNSSVQWVPVEVDKFSKSPTSSGSSSPTSSYDSNSSDLSNGSVDMYPQQWYEPQMMLQTPPPKRLTHSPGMNPYASPNAVGISPTKGSSQPVQHGIFQGPSPVAQQSPMYSQQPRTNSTASMMSRYDGSIYNSYESHNSFSNNIQSFQQLGNVPMNYPPVSPRQPMIQNPQQLMHGGPMMSNNMSSSQIVQNSNMGMMNSPQSQQPNAQPMMSNPNLQTGNQNLTGGKKIRSRNKL